MNYAGRPTAIAPKTEYICVEKREMWPVNAYRKAHRQIVFPTCVETCPFPFPFPAGGNPTDAVTFVGKYRTGPYARGTW